MRSDQPFEYNDGSGTQFTIDTLEMKDDGTIVYTTADGSEKTLILPPEVFMDEEPMPPEYVPSLRPTRHDGVNYSFRGWDEFDGAGNNMTQLLAQRKAEHERSMQRLKPVVHIDNGWDDLEDV